MREVKFLRAMTDIDDAFLQEAEALRPRKLISMTRGKLRAMMAAAIVFTLMISVGAVYLYQNWEDIFIDRFHPEEAVMEHVDDSVHSVLAISQCGEVEVRIDQTIGDSTALYLDLEIRLPAHIDVEDYVTLADDGEMYSLIWPEDVQFYYRGAAYEDIRGFTPEQTEAWFGNTCFSSGMISIENYPVDVENNALRFLVGFFDDSNQITGGDISLVIGSLSAESDETYETLLEGPFIVSWEAKNTGEVREYELLQNGTTVGSATLSSFSLKVHLDAADESACDTLRDITKLVQSDGTLIDPQGATSASYVAPPGAVDLCWEFDEILLLDGIEGVQIEGYTCHLAEKQSK